jgi:tetratricopeptide (TPR) repeat protein
MLKRILLITVFSLNGFLLFAQTLRSHSSANYYYEKGEEALKKHAYKTALGHFNECLRIDPYFMIAYYSRAITREGLGDKQGALTDYNIYLEARPEDKEALFSRAVSRYDFGQWAVAQEDFLKLLKLPAGGETNTVYFQTSQSADGITKAFTAQNNLKGTILNYLGLIETKLENFEEAIGYFNRAIDLNPTDPDYFLNRGITHLTKGDSINAVKDFEETLRLNPESSLARHNLAIVNKSNSYVNDSETLLNEAIEKNPALPYPYAERGLLRLKKGDQIGALEDYNEAIKINPKEPDYWLNRGIIKEQSKDLQGALEDYKQVITLKPDYEKGWLNHGNVLVKLNRFEDAIEDYSVAIFYYLEYGLAYYNRGIAYHRIGKLNEACNDLTKAKSLQIKVDPKMMSKICHTK